MARICTLFLLICLYAHSGIQAAQVTPMSLGQRKAVVNLPGMCSLRPARRWDEALVTGNGIMGASVYGQPYDETVIFNHERLFRPFLDRRPLPPKIASAVPEVRRLMIAGKNSEAHEYWRKVMAENGHSKIINTPPYHPAYAMKVHRDNAGPVVDYLRTVDFMTGEAHIRWQNAKGRWHDKAFGSRADNVIVQLFESRDGQAVSLELSLRDATEHAGELSVTDAKEMDTWLNYRFKYQKTARGYEGTTRVIFTGGNIEVTDNTVRCSGAQRVLLLTRINSLEDFATSDLQALQQSLSQLPADYFQLLGRHLKLHRAAMERLSLNLDQSDDRYLSSEELIARQSQTREIIPAFLQKMFNMGRYALLSSSGVLPPPLTGIWNGAGKPAWSGDWTLDTNLNQQIAGASTAAMKEALMAYLNLIEEIAPSWELNAKHMYGCRGIRSGARTAGRENYDTHFGKWPGHCWNAGAAWLVYPLYEYYLVTGDQDFLKEHALPLMEKVVLFYEDFLTEVDADGKFLFVPSYSPETYKAQSINAVQDIAAAKEAVRTLIEAYQDLGIMAERVTQLRAMFGKFPPYLINEEGVFKEWAYPTYKETFNHRHMSHSYPVWPAHELNWEAHPDLVRAMRVALERRLPQGWSGHGFAVRAFCAARTKYPQLFWQNLYTLMRYDYIQANLVTRHNPGWAPNTDVLCGLPGMISEGLVYSKPGVIELLPAWSPALPNGSVQGIRCRTQATVDMLAWDLDKRAVSATIASSKDQWITLYMRQGIKSLEADTEASFSEHGDIARRLFLRKASPVRVTVYLDKAMNDYPVNTPAFTLDEADRVQAEREAKRKAKK